MTTSTAPNHPMTPWTPDDYAPLVTFTGAHKLASSGVAPLVAAARGYETIESSHVPAFAKTHGFGSSNTKRYAQLHRITQYTDALVLMWYQADQVALARTNDQTPIFTTMQLRPGVARPNASGKFAKYENMAGSESVIDMNPATPAEWFTDSPRVLMTEGVIKGDSALTALLRANGVGDDELLSGGLTRIAACQRLNELMLRVPVENRVTILSLIGVGNWKGNDLWVSLSLANRELLLAFDGDVATNWNVWNQANNLWRFAFGRGARVKLVDLSLSVDEELVQLMADGPRTGSFIASVDDIPAAGDKVGLDDFLAKHGTWNNILERLQAALPDSPRRQRGHADTGTWRVAEDNNSVQALLPGPPDMDGKPGPLEWKVQMNIGGHVASVETHRAPSSLEVKTGRFGAGLEEEDIPTTSTCRFDLQWLKEDGITEHAIVTGPATLLMYPPEQWDKMKANLPNNLLLHPEWPPGRDGMKWLSAIKDNVEVPTQQNVSWSRMGWVPVEGSSVCSFISGRTIISPNDEDKAMTIAGVTDIVLPGASNFGLPKSEPVVMSHEWVEQVRTDLTALREHYVENAPWTDVNIAAVVMAAGLRPSVPISCTTAIWVQGPPGQGKSWSVAQILSFHQQRATWTNKKLPGSMKDTATGVEQAIAQANIWVMDDLAPSPDKRTNDLEQAKIGDIVRSIHNKSSKRRSGVDLKAREVFVPHALLLVTAENEHTINSVRDRTVVLNLDRNSLRSDEARDEMDDFRDNNRAPGRLMAAAVQAFQHLATLNGWPKMMSNIEGSPEDGVRHSQGSEDLSIMGQYRTLAKEVIGGVKVTGKSDGRHVNMAVDLMLGLAPLQVLAQMVHDSEMLALMNPATTGSLPARVAAVVSLSYRSQSESTPGLAILGAVRNLLAAGKAHILNANDPALPPLANTQYAANRALGWQVDTQDRLRPLGTAIGYLTAAGATGEMDVVMLHPVNAFDQAQRTYPIALPAGTSPTTSFGSLWNEKLIHPHYLAKGRDGNRVGKVFSVAGHSNRSVPIHIDLILGERMSADGGESE
ncbi:hypothetical protein QN355_08990 [Cryobacterium sp. 10S3]|uniref:hypothetical protein n=1 Tax=unclassified Cryobacterium TaxID=2649013 RepID=UPI002AC9CDE2|nr:MULTISPECIES: hypothetical protein [unclassified Cryobacterium]MEB0001653.1 hypothetical protein [Cryobacterium sp. RTC2.1]MEB0286684.1 hypothetical protein [Cryobacterium sp. 10S3]WPX13195.1 hypothetical protein RHM57_16220 [Cryobacterium sp. 10S3]